MVTDTFFDLQRFADDTLVADNGTLKWQGGGTFVNDGTEESPVYHLAATGGVSAVTDTEIALDGTKAGYTFAVDGSQNDWAVSVKGTKNTITADFAEGSYELNGNVDVAVSIGKTFDETVNGQATYVKASRVTGADVNISAAGTDAITYTFNTAIGGAVGVDSNDTAVFNGGAANVTLGPAASSDSMTAHDIYFINDGTGSSTVTSSGTNVVIGVTEKTTVIADDKTWAFDNKSSRQVSDMVINADGDVASVSATKEVSLVSGLYPSTAEVNNDLTVNINGTEQKWEQITGDIASGSDAAGNATVSAIVFDKDGAKINNVNDGAVTVKSSTGEHVGFSSLTAAGVVANDVTIQAVAGGFSTFAVDLTANTGIDGIALDEIDTAVKVAGDKEFEVKAEGATFNVATSADDITFDVEPSTNTRYTDDALALVATIASGKEYSVTGGDADLITREIAHGGSASFGVNGATVQIKNSSVTSDFYHISTDNAKEGVDVVGYLKMNDEVNVTSDGDGYQVVYYKDAGEFADSEIVTFTANGAKISAYAGIFGTGVGNAVSITANASGTEVTVQGIPGNAIVSVSSGATYHFKNALDKNTVTVGGGAEYTEVTLTAGGNVVYNPVQGKVEDLIDDNDIPRRTADATKWFERATVGGSTVNGAIDDTVVSNHAQVYEDFYNLTGNISANTLAGYANQDDTVPTESSQAINITGNTNLGEAQHVTISGGSEIGQVPINIQSNENPYVTDVTVDLTNSSVPSSIAVGTTGAVAAAHDVRLSTAGTQNSPSYGFIGAGATGENKLTATSGYNVLRHDGENRASIYGGTGNDTIRGDVNDIVTGNAGADYFYDYTGYATDYQVGEGDVIIASRLASLDEVTAANIRGTGNQVGFGNGEYLLTLGNIDQNEQVHVKVAVMDDDGNVMKGVRDVVLANGNGTVDATAAGDNGALVISNVSRDNGLGNGMHVVIGSTGNDTIHVGAFDAVSGAAGNDSIAIDQGAAGVIVAMSAGSDSVAGWNFGFDRAAGATQLNTNGAQARGRVFEDRLLISLDGGESMSFEDTKQFYNHGQYDVLVNNLKFTAIRNGDANALNEASQNGLNPLSQAVSSNLGYAYVNENDKIADYYLSEREGWVIFDTGVTDNVGQNLGTYGAVDLTSENFQYIRRLTLNNNSKTLVYGSSDRETVTLGGAASVGANKVVSLGADNDVIFSGGDGNGIASHILMFGTGDGRDSVFSYNHYQGINEDPDKQTSDLIALSNISGVKVEVDENNAARVEFSLNENDQAVVYENTATYDYNRDMYRVQIGAAQGIAKIGYSTIANAFSYNKEVSFYVGSSGEANDSLVVANMPNENVEIWLDNAHDVNGDGVNEFYRGIGVVDASAETYTNISIAGGADSNTIIAGNDGTTNFLWGGIGGENLLVGGTGTDYFLYAGGITNDTISGYTASVEGQDSNDASTQDFIYLAGMTIDDINTARMSLNRENYGITENAVTVDFKNGGSLTVEVTNQDRVQFWMQDGSVYTASRETGGWVQEKGPGAVNQ